jgi:hypothetical protein
MILLSPPGTVVNVNATIPAPELRVTIRALADGDSGMAYMQTATADNGTQPYLWSVVGDLPAGLSCNAASGVISGTPTTQETKAFSLVVTDASGATASQDFTIKIHNLSSKYQRMFAGNIVLWYKENEPIGITVAHDSSPTIAPGTFVNVTMGTAGPDGETAGLYTTAPVSSCAAFSAALAAKFSGDEFTFMSWNKLAAPAAAWANANYWEIFQFASAANYIDVTHIASVDGLQFRCSGVGGVAYTGLSQAGWFHTAASFSKTAARATLWVDGVPIVAAVAAFWVPPLTGAVMANAINPIANSAFPGQQAHQIVLDRRLSLLEGMEAARLQDSGVWDVRGVVLEPSDPTLQNQYIGEANLRKGPPRILAGATNVFQLYYSAGDDVAITSVAYAESYDCVNWTQYAGNPIMAGATRCSGPTQVAGIWYMVAQTPATRLNIYTSPDGLVWTLLAADLLSATSYNSCLIYDPTEAHPWILFYDLPTGFPAYPYQIGLAQADAPGGPWIPSASNPIITEPEFSGVGNGNIGGAFAYKSTDGTWHVWAQGQGPSIMPTDIYRFDAPAVDGPYTQGPSGPALPRYNPETRLGVADSQVADVTILSDPETETTYALFSSVANQTKGISLSLATSPLTLDQIVATNEGIVPTANHEQLVNPSFEMTGLGGATFAHWVDTPGTGTIARTTTAGEVLPDSSRLAACKLTAGAGGNTCITQTLTELVPKQLYVLTGMGRGDGAHPGRIRVRNNAGVDVVELGAALTTALAAYAPLSVSFICPPDGVAVVSLWCPTTAGGFACFDGLSIRRA